ICNPFEKAAVTGHPCKDSRLDLCKVSDDELVSGASPQASARVDAVKRLAVEVLKVQTGVSGPASGGDGTEVFEAERERAVGAASIAHRLENAKHAIGLPPVPNVTDPGEAGAVACFPFLAGRIVLARRGRRGKIVLLTFDGEGLDAGRLLATGP